MASRPARATHAAHAYAESGAYAESAVRERRARAAERLATPRRSAAARRGGTRVRWDRVGRLAMLMVLFILLLLYIGPARSWWSKYNEAKHQRANVSRLERENAALRAQRAALARPTTVEAEARKLGMVRRGERSYIVQGLPGN